MGDFIQHTSKALSQQECDAIIDFFESHSENQEKVDSKSKKMTEIRLDVGYLSNDSVLMPVAINLRDTCNEYLKKYSFLNKISSWRVDTCIKIQKYKPNEAYFNVHCENDGRHRNRLIAFMIYLNNVTDKGQTYFPTQNISFTPKVGDILMWPAYWTHPHHGIPSPSQIKYIMTGWYVFDD
tara:strand:+ start:112 stop:654 length:543 start_codon:yes stop_codon:yes gene_type:complete